MELFWRNPSSIDLLLKWILINNEIVSNGDSYEKIIVFTFEELMYKKVFKN